MVPDAPEPGSHDRSTPSGGLEESSLAIFEAMLAARDAEASGEGGRAALDAFYRTLMSGTLLLPVPPDHGDEAKAALASAVEFLLEGLHLARRVNKDRTGGGTVYRR